MAFIAIALALGSNAARAQAQPDTNTRATARRLASEGIKLFDQGHYAEALEKFNVADSLIPAPTLGLRAARCLVKLGRYVEASERYVEVTRVQLDRNANPTLRKAQADAVAERDKLVPRIPLVQIIVEGPQGEGGVAVTIDDHAVSSSLLGQKQPIDPGTHKIRARRAEDSINVNAEVTLAEGAFESVLLKLPPLPLKPEPPPKKEPGHLQRTIGWAATIAGGGGLLIGTVNGLLAVGNRSSLLDQCPNRQCPPSAYGQASLYDAERAISTTGFLVGAIGLAAGLPLLLTAPPKDDNPKPARRFVPYLAPGGFGVRGAF